MICKWCGETLKTGAKTCRRCKREIPAKSDCGGFYDLVPTPGTQPPAAASPAPVMPAMPESAPYGAAAPGKKKRDMNPKILFAGAAALILILLVMVISLSGKLEEANDRIARLQDERSDKQNTELTEGAGNINGFDSTEPSGAFDTAEPDEDEIPESMDTITIENGTATFAFDKDHCDALQHGSIYIEVLDSEQQRVAVVSLTLEKEAENRALIVDVTQLAEGCRIVNVNYKDGENPLSEDVKPGAPYELEDASETNITCSLTGYYEDESQFTIEITDIEIQ